MRACAREIIYISATRTRDLLSSPVVGAVSRLIVPVDGAQAAPKLLVRHPHALRSEHFRYTRYAEGSEELYGHRGDPHE